MTKKTWETPTIKELNVNQTEYGTTIKVHVDAVYTDGQGHKYYSFS